MNIGIFTDTYTPDINGVVSSEVTLKRALERLGHSVFVVTNHKGAKIKMEDDHVLRLPGIEMKQLYGYKASAPTYPAAMPYIERMNLDVIHLQTEFGVGIFGMAVAKNLGIPCVATYHTMFEDYTHYVNPLDIPAIEKGSRWGVRYVSRLSENHRSALIAPSQKTKEALLSYGIVVPIYVVATGLDFSKFDPANLDQEKLKKIREEAGVKEDDHTVVFVGRLAMEKSLDMLIEGIEKSTDEKLKLIVVGSGPDEEKFKEQVKEKGMDNRIHFVGAVPSEEVPYYYAAFDLFASASLTETQGMTFIEALASGKRILGRRDEVLKDLVVEGKTGYYFDSSEEFIEKCETYFHDENRKDYDPNCRKQVEPYSDEVFAHKVASVYEQARQDYANTFVVKKIRLFDDYALLVLKRKSDKDEIKIFIPYDDYIELKIGIDTKLDDFLVRSYLDLQPYYNAYMRVKDRCLAKDYSKSQVEAFCHYKLGLDSQSAKQIIDELEKHHLLDDKKLAFEKAEYWQAMGYSKKQIQQKLHKLGIDQPLIEQALASLNNEKEFMNAQVLAKKFYTSLKEQSNRMKKQKIVSKLAAAGYSMEIAKQVTSVMDFDTANDYDSLEAALNKAKRMYSSFDEPKRSQKIRLYCLRKGYSSSMIDELMEGLEDTENEN